MDGDMYPSFLYLFDNNRLGGMFALRGFSLFLWRVYNILFVNFCL